MDKKLAQNLVDKTRDDYNKIAPHFSSTRYAFNWPRVVKAIEILAIPPKSKVLDLGCGNGRATEILSKNGNKYTGLDISEDLIGFARERHPEVKYFVGDLLDAPFPSKSFDYVISLATLHHIPSAEKRLQALKEIYRLLTPGGTTLITVWYFWNDPGFEKFLEKEPNEMDFGDFLKPWKDSQGKVLVERYFHAWKEDEIAEFFKKAGFTGIKITKADDKKNNLIVVAKKPS